MMPPTMYMLFRPLGIAPLPAQDDAAAISAASATPGALKLTTLGGRLLWEHPDRKPVSTLAELELLDDAEMAEGYADGRAGEPEPGGNRGRAYWHGWRNGRVDGGYAQPDAAMIRLAREVRLRAEAEREAHHQKARDRIALGGRPPGRRFRL